MADKCGAKTRVGGRCRKPKMPNGRCRFHGGMSTGPKTPNTKRNAFKHGIYARLLNAQAKQALSTNHLGTLDHELRIARFQLSMAMEAQARANGEPELEEIVEHDLVGFGSKKDTTTRVRDYAAIIDKRLARIESLEKSRLMLITKLGLDDPPDMDAGKLTPGTPDEPPPANPIR